MKEVKVGKYSKAWFRRMIVIRNRVFAAITFVGLFALLSFVGVCECDTIVDYIVFYGLISGPSAFLSFMVYSIFKLDFDHFDEIYENFLFDMVYYERKRQDKKMKKWLI